MQSLDHHRDVRLPCQEAQQAKTWLEGNWLSDRYWKVWYDGNVAVKKQEVNEQGTPVGPVIKL